MTELSDESNRLSGQISSLSTQLIESIDKQSQLEEKLNQARRTIQIQKKSVENTGSLLEQVETLKNTILEKDAIIKESKEAWESENKLRLTAEKAVDELNHEIEDLTASLFDEANNMVATARKETHAVEVKNSKLIEQLKEKDSILETLDLQLKDLKKVLQNLEDEASSNPKISNVVSSSGTSLERHVSNMSNIESFSDPIYSPNITSIRYDLGLYSEFLKFIAVLPHCDSIKDTASESKLLRRLVNDEIQPIIRIDNASGLGWIIRRTLMSLMMDGLVVVEPLSGLNETFQFGHASPQLKGNADTTPKSSSMKDAHLFNFPANSPPIAVYEKCSFCGESRNDVIEHARMFVLKTLSRTEMGELVVTNSFPLCNYCLLKLRQTCEIFAFLRSLKLGAWNLERVTLTTIANGESDKFSQVSESQSGSRGEGRKQAGMSYLTGLGMTPKLTPHVDVRMGQVGGPSTNIQRAWLQLCKLRSTLHWTHIGVWSVKDCIESKFGPIGNGEDTSDNSIKTEDNYKLEQVTSTEVSFTLRKENEDNDSNGIFGVENAEHTEKSEEKEISSKQDHILPDITQSGLSKDAIEQADGTDSEEIKKTGKTVPSRNGELKLDTKTRNLKTEESNVKPNNGPAILEDNSAMVQGSVAQISEANGRLSSREPEKAKVDDDRNNSDDSYSKEDEFDDAREQQSYSK